jgi:hypothetical protein
MAVVDPTSGLHIFEVKGVTLAQVRSVLTGGTIEIAYNGRTSRKDPVKQARRAMFAIKDSASRHFGGELNVPFQSWVVFPRIGREEWKHKFGEAVSARPDVLFVEDVNSSDLGTRLREAGIARLQKFGLTECPSLQLRSVMAAFGDPEVLESRRLASEREAQASEPLLAQVRDTVQRALQTSRGWADLQRTLRMSDLEYVECGRGLAVRRKSDATIICKASEVGPGYFLLIKRFQSPFPGHRHQWLADRVLGRTS